ncbi:MAG: nitrogen fixation protein FixH [Gammaproteobacteria bacterium]|nr:MAG: nitrogen fixation protein FixH [Gammaproteobacteria bacterium]
MNQAEVLSMSKQRPWYRHGWLWFVIALPLSAVIAGLTTVYIAASDPDSLVVDDYYKEGLAINSVLDRERSARQMGLRGDLMIAGDRLRVTLLAARPLDALDRIEVRFIHPTRDRFDQTVELERIGPGVYEGSLDKLVPTRWYVHVLDPDESWRLEGRLDSSRESVLHLDAALTPHS